MSCIHVKGKMFLTHPSERLSNQLGIIEEFREKAQAGVINHKIVNSEITFKAL